MGKIVQLRKDKEKERTRSHLIMLMPSRGKEVGRMEEKSERLGAGEPICV